MPLTGRLLLLVALFLMATANLRFWSIALEATAGGSTSRVLVLGAVALALFTAFPLFAEFRSMIEKR